jgi:hypothetical protein
MINFYCNTHKNLNPRHYQQKQYTLMCGSALMPLEVKNIGIDKGYLTDDTFDNISYLNNLLGDLTGLYWVWKNTNHEFVGVNQYCRFYDDNEISNLKLDENTLYVSNFKNFGNISVWEQYKYWHTDLGIKMLYKSINSKKISITENMANQLYFYNKLSTCNSFFSHNSIFNNLCEIIFNILFELYEGSKYTIEHIQENMHRQRPNDKRLLAFLNERILNIVYHNIQYFLGDKVKIFPINFNYY